MTDIGRGSGGQEDVGNQTATGGLGHQLRALLVSTVLREHV